MTPSKFGVGFSQMMNLRVLLVLLFLSAALNISALGFYFYKYLPLQKEFSGKAAALNNSCKKVWSTSTSEFVCLTKEEEKSNALSDCSKNFRESLNADVLKKISSVDDLTKIRDLAVKMCMQEKGFDY